MRAEDRILPLKQVTDGNGSEEWLEPQMQLHCGWTASHQAQTSTVPMLRVAVFIDALMSFPISWQTIHSFDLILSEEPVL